MKITIEEANEAGLKAIRDNDKNILVLTPNYNGRYNKNDNKKIIDVITNNLKNLKNVEFVETKKKTNKNHNNLYQFNNKLNNNLNKKPKTSTTVQLIPQQRK